MWTYRQSYDRLKEFFGYDKINTKELNTLYSKFLRNYYFYFRLNPEIFLDTKISVHSNELSEKFYFPEDFILNNKKWAADNLYIVPLLKNNDYSEDTLLYLKNAVKRKEGYLAANYEGEEVLCMYGNVTPDILKDFSDNEKNISGLWKNPKISLKQVPDLNEKINKLNQRYEHILDEAGKRSERGLLILYKENIRGAFTKDYYLKYMDIIVNNGFEDMLEYAFKESYVKDADYIGLVKDIKRLHPSFFLENSNSIIYYLLLNPYIPEEIKLDMMTDNIKEASDRFILLDEYVRNFIIFNPKKIDNLDYLVKTAAFLKKLEAEKNETFYLRPEEFKRMSEALTEVKGIDKLIEYEKKSVEKKYNCRPQSFKQKMFLDGILKKIEILDYFASNFLNYKNKELINTISKEINENNFSKDFFLQKK